MRPYSSDPFRDNQQAAALPPAQFIRQGGQKARSQFGVKPTLANTGIKSAIKAVASCRAQEEQGRARQAARQQERVRRATPTQVSDADTTIKPEDVNCLSIRCSGFDYLIRNNGEIHARRTQNAFDRFYLESSARSDVPRKLIIRQYKLVGTFAKNENGYIALPDLFETNTFAFRYTGSVNENYIACEI